MERGDLRLAFHGVSIADCVSEVRREERIARLFRVEHIEAADEAELPEDEYTTLRETPLWDHMAALAPHSVREWEVLIQERPTVERYREVTVPTLLLAGSETTNHPSFATEDLEDTLLDAHLELFDGQGHTAHLAAPDSVAQAVSEFCLNQRARSE